MNDTVVSDRAGSEPAVTTTTPATSPSLADIIERWWEEHFPGSPVAQVTAAWNHAFAAKEELKRFLQGG